MGKSLVLDWRRSVDGGAAATFRHIVLEVRQRSQPLGDDYEAALLFHGRRVAQMEICPTLEAAQAHAEKMLVEYLAAGMPEWTGLVKARAAKAAAAARKATQYTPEQVAALKKGDSVGIYLDAKMTGDVGRIIGRTKRGKVMVRHGGTTEAFWGNGERPYRLGFRDDRYLGPPTPPEGA